MQWCLLAAGFVRQSDADLGAAVVVRQNGVELAQDAPGALHVTVEVAVSAGCPALDGVRGPVARLLRLLATGNPVQDGEGFAANFAAAYAANGFGPGGPAAHAPLLACAEALERGDDVLLALVAAGAELGVAGAPAACAQKACRSLRKILEAVRQEPTLDNPGLGSGGAVVDAYLARLACAEPRLADAWAEVQAEDLTCPKAYADPRYAPKAPSALEGEAGASALVEGGVVLVEPCAWQQVLDPGTGRLYWYHSGTGASQWEPPGAEASRAAAGSWAAWWRQVPAPGAADGPLLPALVPPEGATYVFRLRDRRLEGVDPAYDWFHSDRQNSWPRAVTLVGASGDAEKDAEIRARAGNLLTTWRASTDVPGGGRRAVQIRDASGRRLFDVRQTRYTLSPQEQNPFARYSYRVTLPDAGDGEPLFTLNRDHTLLDVTETWRLFRGRKRSKQLVYVAHGPWQASGHTGQTVIHGPLGTPGELLVYPAAALKEPLDIRTGGLVDKSGEALADAVAAIHAPGGSAELHVTVGPGQDAGLLLAFAVVLEKVADRQGHA